MRSRPASQLADDGEAVGTPVTSAYDPSSAEPPVTHGDGENQCANWNNPAQAPCPRMFTRSWKTEDDCNNTKCPRAPLPSYGQRDPN